MLDIIMPILTSVLGVLMGFIGATVAIKKWIKPEIILQFSDMILDEFTDNMEYQKKVYLIGGLLGQGVKAGLGLPKTGGKFKIEDAIGQLLGSFIQRTAERIIQPQQTTPQEAGLSKNF